MENLNSRALVVIVSLISLGSAANAGADVSVRFSTGHRHGRSDYRPYNHYAGAYYAPYPYPRYRHGGHYAPYRPVVVAPILVPQPVYLTPPAPVPALSGNYGQDIADFRERLNRLRSVVQKQKEKGVLARDVHDRFMNALDGIERDQQARSYNRGGTMHDEDFTELYRRLDQTDEDIERALAG